MELDNAFGMSDVRQYLPRFTIDSVGEGEQPFSLSEARQAIASTLPNPFSRLRITAMLKLPPAVASDDDWDEFTNARSVVLVSNLCDFIVERFTYKPRYVQQQVSISFGTISARTKKFDLYFRLFARPDHICPRECLVIARIGFKQQRAGHGKALVSYLLELAPTIGYRHIAIECANANSAAFAERLGFSPFENRRHWVGSVDAIRAALSAESLAHS